jgi:separase
VFGQALHKVRTEKVSASVRARFLLRYAESLALVSNPNRRYGRTPSSSTLFIELPIRCSIATYGEAVLLSDVIADNDKSMPTSERIRARANRLEHAALACRAHAAISYNNVRHGLRFQKHMINLWYWYRVTW